MATVARLGLDRTRQPITEEIQKLEDELASIRDTIQGPFFGMFNRIDVIAAALRSMDGQAVILWGSTGIPSRIQRPLREKIRRFREALAETKKELERRKEYEALRRVIKASPLVDPRDGEPLSSQSAQPSNGGNNLLLLLRG